jgi:hypothetical protein
LRTNATGDQQLSSPVYIYGTTFHALEVDPALDHDIDTLPHPLHFYLQAKKEELRRSDHGFLFLRCPDGPLTTLVPLTIAGDALPKTSTRTSIPSHHSAMASAMAKTSVRMVEECHGELA